METRRVFRLIALVALLSTFAIAQTAGANSLKLIEAKALEDHECNDTETHFVITQVDSETLAPASIHVVWANGQEQDVGRTAFTGKTAHYATTANLDSTVDKAYTNIYVEWGGEFNLSHGPCPPPPPPPGDCFEQSTESGCAEGLVEQGGICVNPVCPSIPTCVCLPKLDWSANCEGFGLSVDNPDNLDGLVEYEWKVDSAIGGDTIPGTCILPACSGFTAPWPIAPVGETDVTLSWTTTWDEGGTLDWNFQCGEMPSASVGVDCGSYSLGIDAGTWPETVNTEVKFSVSHQLGTFDLQTGISTEPGTANSFLSPWSETLYGSTTILWSGTTSWGEAIAGSWEGICGGICEDTTEDCPDWQCGSWSECQDFVQTKACTRTCKYWSKLDPDTLCYSKEKNLSKTRSCGEFVPEPGTVTLLGSGLIGLGGYIGLRRRPRR